MTTLPKLEYQTTVTENDKPTLVFQRWWQSVASTLEAALASIQANVLEIQNVLGIATATETIVNNGLNPDGTVKAGKVTTTSVQAGAVITTPGSSVTSSTTLTSGSYTWTDCGDVIVTTYGNPVIVRVDFDTEVVDNCKFMYRVQCDGTTLGRERGPVSVNTADEPGYGIVRRHTPSAGSHTYKLQCAVNDANDIIIHDPVFDITENRNV